MLAKRLFELRHKKGKTQADMAKMLGITRQAYGYYEKGERDPDTSTLNVLADYFDVNIDYLLGRTDDPSPSDKKERQLSEVENLFFYELDKLSEEDKQKALEHVRYLRYLAEKENKK
ncbi:helix-turn-helix domain-containing protein [Brevibacillus massiliensis]|uniref:helix-turn-helix domain-containing protein n=1 Tax=Brevibacillus massiliensis TaxID=1118054 RepID=UPI00030DD70C|nr:helix-turn-helix transcriptional regulator [Brevibacillus massiliensis]